MARKNSPALFEVIRAAQQKQQEQLERQQQQKLNAELHAQSPAAALLRSPLYWFKGKQAHETEHGVVAAEKPVAKAAPAKSAAPKAGPVMRQVPRTPAAAPAAAPSAQPVAQPVAKSQPTAQPVVPPAMDAESAPFEVPFSQAQPSEVTEPQEFTAHITVQPPVEFNPPESQEGESASEESISDDAAQTRDFAEPAFEATVEPQDFARPAYTAPAYSAPVYAPAPMSAAALAAQQVRDEIAAQDAPAAEPMFEPTNYAGGRSASLSPFGLDEDDSDAPRQKTFTLNFNFTTAIVAGFAILVAVVVGVVISSAGKKEQTQLAGAKNNVRPEVLNVQPTQTYTAPVPTPANTREDDTRASINTANESLALETLGTPIPEPTNVKRVVGYQYMVLLSFPREEDAKKLVKFLAQNGVPATAEKALPDYAKSWTSVVTARGFDHTKNNPAFDNYSTALKGLLQKYAGDSKFRKTFKIDVYTWRKAG